MTMSAPTDEFWRKLATLIERPELGNDARYATVAERLKRQDEVYQAIEAFTQTKTKSELAALFGDVISFAPIYDAADIFADEHFQIREMLVDVEQQIGRASGMESVCQCG